MKYALLIYGDEQAAAQATEAEFKAVSDAYEAFTKSIIASGSFLDGDPFMPTSTAKTVQVQGEETKTVDGPAVTTSPQIVAYYKVEAEGPEQAVEMASRIPGARFGAVEVRPIVQFD